MRVMVSGKDGEITELRRARVCTGVWNQILSNEGGRSVRQKNNRCKVRRKSEAGEGRRVNEDR